MHYTIELPPINVYLCSTMKNFITGLLVFLAAPLLSQINEDSLRVERLRQVLNEELQILNSRYAGMLRENAELQLKFDSLQKQVASADSVNQRNLELLAARNLAAFDSLASSSSRYQQKISSLEMQLYENRKGNAMLAIVLFSLLILIFVYLFYRNYKLELKFVNQLNRISHEMEKNYYSVKEKIRKKLGKIKTETGRKLEKEISKSTRKNEKLMDKREKEMDKRINKLRKNLKRK